MMAKKRRITYQPKALDVVSYIGQGGVVLSRGQTVRVKATARRGYVVVEAIHPQGHVIPVSVKAEMLTPLAEQLF